MKRARRMPRAGNNTSIGSVLSRLSWANSPLQASVIKLHFNCISTAFQREDGGIAGALLVSNITQEKEPTDGGLCKCACVPHLAAHWEFSGQFGKPVGSSRLSTLTLSIPNNFHEHKTCYHVGEYKESSTIWSSPEIRETIGTSWHYFWTVS